MLTLQLIRALSFPNLRAHPARTLVTVIGVALGVAAFVGIANVNRSVIASFEDGLRTIAGESEPVEPPSADVHLARGRSIEPGEHVVALLRSLVKERGLALLAVTHAVVVARACDRILEIRDGRLLAPAGSTEKADTGASSQLAT